MRISNEMATPQEFTAPLKIELRAKQDGEHMPHTHMVLKYADGNILINWFDGVCHLLIENMEGDREYWCKDVAADGYIDIEWILGREFMSVKLNGELRHIREFRDNPGNNLSSAVTVRTNTDRSTVVVKSLRVTEI